MRDSPLRAVPASSEGGTGIGGPLVRAGLAAAAGATVLVLVGGVLASTAGLLFVSGLTGAVIGLTLSRAAVPSPTSDSPEPRVASRATVTRAAVLLACAAVIVAAVGTWLVALAEGGSLGLLEYLWTAFGPFVPAELAIAALAAAWAARTGPVTSR